MNPKIIFLGPTGNKLYGVIDKDNSESFTSIFIPSPEQILGTLGYEQEYYKDSTYFISLPRFLKKLSEDNLHAIEVLFTPPSLVKYKLPEWDLLSERAKSCLGQTAAANFFEEATRLLETLPSSNEALEAFQVARIINNLPQELLNLPLNAVCAEDKSGNLKLDQYILSTFINEADEQMVAIGGKQYLATTRVRTIRDKMRSVELRTVASSNKDESYDFGTIATAIRYADQGKQLIEQGKLTFPTAEKALIEQVLSGTLAKNNTTWIQDIKTKVKQTKNTKSPSRKKLREETDKALLNELCIAALKAHINS